MSVYRRKASKAEEEFALREADDARRRSNPFEKYAQQARTPQWQP